MKKKDKSMDAQYTGRSFRVFQGSDSHEEPHKVVSPLDFLHEKSRNGEAGLARYPHCMLKRHNNAKIMLQLVVM